MPFSDPANPRPNYVTTPVPSVELLLLIGKMDGKLDVLVTAGAHMESRLTKLEAWQNKAVGIGLAAGLFAGAAGSQIGRLAGLLASPLH